MPHDRICQDSQSSSNFHALASYLPFSRSSRFSKRGKRSTRCDATPKRNEFLRLRWHFVGHLVRVVSGASPRSCRRGTLCESIAYYQTRQDLVELEAQTAARTRRGALPVCTRSGDKRSAAVRGCSNAIDYANVPYVRTCTRRTYSPCWNYTPRRKAACLRARCISDKSRVTEACFINSRSPYKLTRFVAVTRATSRPIAISSVRIGSGERDVGRLAKGRLQVAIFFFFFVCLFGEII